MAAIVSSTRHAPRPRRRLLQAGGTQSAPADFRDRNTRAAGLSPDPSTGPVEATDQAASGLAGLTQAAPDHTPAHVAVAVNFK